MKSFTGHAQVKAAFLFVLGYYETPFIEEKELLTLGVEWRTGVISTDCCFENFLTKFS